MPAALRPAVVAVAELYRFMLAGHLCSYPRESAIRAWLENGEPGLAEISSGP